MVVHQQCVLAGLGVAEDGAQRILDECGGLGDGVGLVGQLRCGMGTFAVTWRPASMAVVMVLAVPLGPIPLAMNIELIRGVGRFSLALAAVETGLGVMTMELLQVLQILMFAVRMACMEVISQGSPGKYICICVTAADSRLVMLPMVFLRLTNPPHTPSPLMAVSKARQMLQLVMDRLFFMSGTKEKEIMLRISVAPAHSSSNSIITRIYRCEQGLLSISRRMDSQGGQLRSKRQQVTVKMQKAKKRAAKMMQGTISLEIQLLRAPQSPLTTICCTVFWVLGDWKPAQTKEPIVDTVVSEVRLQEVMLNCAGQLSVVMLVYWVAARYRRHSTETILQFILFYYLQ